MSFTPESMLRAEHLDHPRVNTSADPLQFVVEWAYHEKDASKIDPIVEIFRPIRDRIRKEHDIHIVVTGGHWSDQKADKGRIARTYTLSYCPGERQEVDRRILASEFEVVQPRLLASLQEALDAWVEADNGLALFLEAGNKESIHAFLVSIGLRPKEKAARRKAYLAEHPEHAKHQ